MTAAVGKTTYLIKSFQPSEETVGGAKPICDTGIFEKYNVKAIFGTHLWPFIPAGTVASRPEEMMAHASEVTVTVKGKSTHCAKPDEGIDALAIGAGAVYAACTRWKRKLLRTNTGF